MSRKFWSYGVVALLSFLVMGYVQAIELTDYIRDSAGRIRNLSQYQAASECEKLNTRLPTVRELAQYITKSGFSILEIMDYKSGKIPSPFTRGDYALVREQDMGGKIVDSFYCSKKLYQAPSPSDPEGNTWMWSASRGARDYGREVGFLGLDPSRGLWFIYQRHDPNPWGTIAARCVRH